MIQMGRSNIVLPVTIDFLDKYFATFQVNVRNLKSDR